jgi:hypothetical protein
LLALAVVAGGLAVACESPRVALEHAGRSVNPGITGVIAGSVQFIGTPPPPLPRLTTDPTCRQLPGASGLDEAMLIGPTGGLQHAFVYIKSGLDRSHAFDIPTSPVVLDQRGCRFVPRVLGVRVGQVLELINSDPLPHNVHALPVVNAEFNRTQPFQGMRERRVFTHPEVMVRIKCDLHPWMIAHVGVVDHPYYAVTDANGAFSFGNVPPGAYEIEAWHEQLGTQTGRITLGERERASVSLTFSRR